MGPCTMRKADGPPSSAPHLLLDSGDSDRKHLQFAVRGLTGLPLGPELPDLMTPGDSCS
jgi:hypothetical protein